VVVEIHGEGPLLGGVGGAGLDVQHRAEEEGDAAKESMDLTPPSLADG
jgi:hypothetical protein